MRDGDGDSTFKDANSVIKIDAAPKNATAFERAIFDAPSKITESKSENRVVKLGRKQTTLNRHSAVHDNRLPGDVARSVRG